MPNRIAPLALVLTFALIVPSASAQDASGIQDVKEPESGILLPVRLSVLGGAETHVLTGVAVREKTIFAVDVYALGHYVDPIGAATPLAKWKGKTAKELAADGDFIEALLTDGFSRTLRLQLARDVDASDFNDAFQESLGPRVKKLVAAGTAGKAEDVATLKGYFTLDELAEGTKLDFTWSKGGKFTSVMNGKHLGVIQSPALCRAMWDLYFGKKALQKEFPKSLMSRFPGVLGSK